MRQIGRKILFAGALLAIAGPAAAQEAPDPIIEVERENKGYGTTSAEFLQFGAGARGMALAPAFAALTRDVEALYYNPASLPLMEGMEAGFTMMPYFADTNYLWAGLALPLGGGEYGFGISLSSFGFSDAPVYTEEDQTNESQLTYNVRQTAIGLSFAHAFIDRFSGGFTARLISDQLGQTSATGVAFDIGTNYHAELAGRPISMAFVIQNLGTTLKHTGSGLNFAANPVVEDPDVPVKSLDPAPARFEAASSPIPVVFRVGVAYDAVSSASNRLSLLGEFNEAYNTGAGFGAGAEWAWSPEDGPFAAALRGSYAYQADNSISNREEDEFAGYDEADSEGLDGLTLGAGLRYNLAEAYAVKVDYAWRHFGALGQRSVFTVGLGWR